MRVVYSDPHVADRFKILEEKLDCRIFVYDNGREGEFHVVCRSGNNDLYLRDLYIISYERETTHYFPITDYTIR